MTSNKNFGQQPVRISGQHFTKDQSLVHQMINEAQTSKKDVVLGIGAGKGALTKPLSQHANRVIAIERDSKLADDLHQTFQKYSNVKILKMDIRKIPLPNQPFKVVSNIPYAITTELFGKLMDTSDSLFDCGVFITEMGAAKRFTQKSQSDPRIICWNTWFDIKIVKKVARRAFFPPPRVTSALLSISRREPRAICQGDYQRYMAFVATLLEQPNLYVKDGFRAIFSKNQIRRIMNDCEINRSDLIKDLNILQWTHCFQTMDKLIPKQIHPSMPGKYKKLYK